MGFDAGIGPRDRARADMIALRVMGPMKIVVVGAPTYFARRRPPRTPDDLARHSCVQYRLTADGDVLEWPFKRNRKSRRIAVDGQVIVNDADLAVRAAVDGLGIAYALEALAEPFLRSGQLVRVLQDRSPSFEGMFLYYPEEPTSPGHVARPHRHDPHDPRLGTVQTFTPEPFYQGVSGSNHRAGRH